MINEASNILIVDDEPDNIAILSEYLEDDYQLGTAQNGEEAWRLLESDPERFDVILLDRMMPKLDGIGTLNLIKTHDILKRCPVILQSALTSEKDIQAGVDAGAYYYLTKPFDEDMLFPILQSALRTRQNFKFLQRALNDYKSLRGLMDFSIIRFRHPRQIQPLAAMLANTCVNPENVALGLSELMMNAVEHGNLGISYSEKTLFLKQNRLTNEIEKRLCKEENRDRFASIELQRYPDCVKFTIRDKGDGFDWKAYPRLSWKQAMHSHGRGIAIARELSFDRIEYRGCGNEVIAVVDRPRDRDTA